MKYLNFLNIYGEDINLYFDQSTKYKTLSGGILSLIVIIFVSIIMTFTLIQFLTNRNFNVILQNQFSKDFHPILLTNDSYSSIITLLNVTDKIIGFNNYTFTSFENYNKIAKTISVRNVNLSLDLCYKTDVINKMADLIDDDEKKEIFLYINSTTKSYCPILLKDETYEIGGDFLYSGSQSFLITNFTFSLPNNTFNENNLDSLKRSIFFNMLFIDSYPNMTIPEGFSKFVNSYGLFVDFTKDYQITIEYQNNRIITDQGFFYSTAKNNTPFFNIKSILSSSLNRDLVNGEINFYIFSYLNRNENVYTRTYQKLDALFANTRALIFIIYQIFSLINSFINYKKLDLELINLFFQFNEEKPFINEDKPFIKEFENQANSHKLNLVNEDIVTYHLKGRKLEALQSILKKKFKSEILIKEQKRINSNFKDIFCENKKKFNLGEKLLLFHLDIRVILKQLFDLENMKGILFGKDELKVLKLIRDKIKMRDYDLNFKENFIKENFLFMNKNTDEKLDDIVKIVAKFIIQGNNNKKLEKKLLKNLNIKFI